MKKFTAFVLSAAAIILCLNVNTGNASSSRPTAGANTPAPASSRARAAGRVVILAPAAADIFYRLDAAKSVVGVTDSVTEFPDAAKVGTHLNPGIEKIASLHPDLIISSGRFNPELAARMGAELFIYAPATLAEIVQDLRLLARKIDRKIEGEALAASLEAVLEELKHAPNPPTVLYETRSNPLALGKSHTIVKDVLEKAGMKYAYSTATGAVSVEYLMARQPDYYIYQEGPMNRNPIPPASRPGWNNFKACVWKVNEFDFARPNTRLFETVKTLNEILDSENICAAGAKMLFKHTQD